MNQIFKVVWNHATQSFTAVSELAKASGKTKAVTDKRSSVKLAVASTAATLLALTTSVNAADVVIGSERGTNPADLSNSGYADIAILHQGTNPKATGGDVIALGENLTIARAGVIVGKDISATQGTADPGTGSSVLYGSNITVKNHEEDLVLGFNVTVDSAGKTTKGGWANDARMTTILGRDMNVNRSNAATLVGRNLNVSGVADSAFVGSKMEVVDVINSFTGGFENILTNVSTSGVTATRSRLDWVDRAAISVVSSTLQDVWTGAVVGFNNNFSNARNTYVFGGNVTFSGTNTNAQDSYNSPKRSTYDTNNDGSLTGSELTRYREALAKYNEEHPYDEANNRIIDGAVILGDNSSLYGTGSTVSDAVGGRASIDVTDTTINGVTYGGFAGRGVGDLVVSVGADGKERQVKNMAAGVVNATSTDAINGSQLYSVITNSHWKATSGTTGTGTNTGGTVSNEQVNFGDTVKFIAGDNINIAQNGANFTFSAKVPKLKAGDNITLDTDGNGDITISSTGGSNTGSTVVQGSGLATVTGTGTEADPYIVDVAKANAPTITRGNVTIAAGDENKVMTAGDVAKAITDSEKTSSVVADNASAGRLTVAAGTEDSKGNTEYTVGLSKTTLDSLDKADTALQNFTTSVNGNTVETITKDNNDVGFVNGNATTARDSNGNITFDVNVDGSTIKIEGNKLSVVTGNVSINDTTNPGKITVPDGEGDKLANTTTVAKAVNDAYHTITASQSKDQVVANDDTFKVNAGDKVNYVAGKNLVLNMTKNGENVTNVTFGLDKDIIVGGKGADGENGVDGSIGVQGADGKTGVGLNGKDGSIGINGKDGTNANITVAQGEKGIDGNDGADGKTRIVYEKPNGEKEEVATLNDGLYFGGDNAKDVTIARKLNTQLNVTGGYTGNVTAKDNIKVTGDATTNSLKIQLGENVDLGSNGSFVVNGTTIHNNGTISGVANGSAPTDAVNVSQLKAGRTTVTSSDNSISVVDTNDGKGDNFAYDIKVNGQSVIENAQLPVVYSDTNGNKLYKQDDGSFNTKADGTGTKVEPKDVIASMNTGGNNITTPTSLANVKGNLDPSYNTGDNFIDAEGKPTSPANVFANTSMAAPTTEQVKAMYNNAATVGDVLNAGWNLQGNGEAKDFVKPYDTVNFVDGAGTKAVVTTSEDGKVSNVTFNINADGKTITTETKPVVDKDGKPVVDKDGNPVTETVIKANTGDIVVNTTVGFEGSVAPKAGDEDKLMNTTKVAEAINSAYHTITGSQSKDQVVAGDSSFKVNAGDKVNYVAGKNLVLNMTNTGENVTTVTFGLGKDILVGGKGEDGKDGVDGTIGVQGADGKTGVGLNGKDGSIGINGKDGTNANITVAQGPKGIDGNDGKDGKTRIVYVKPNGEKEDVATLNDGLYFGGDTGTDVARKLNTKLNIVGGQTDETKLTDNNIGVVADGNDKLTVKLAKDIDLGKDGSINIGDTKIDNGGLVIVDGPSVKKDGINGGDKKITGVADGDISPTSTDAINGSQLYHAVANTTISNEAGKAKAPEGKEGGKLVNATTVANAINETYHTVNVTNNNNQVVAGGVASQINPGDKVNYVAGKNLVANTTGEVGGTTNIVYGLAKEIELETVTVKGEPGTPGADGKPGVTPGVALNGKDGSIGINGKDGSNADITVEQGQKGLDGNDGKDGESKTRIVYTKPDGKKEEVATLNDGLIFAGDSGKDVERKLNTKLTVKGAETTGSNGTKVKNITVETDPATSSLNVKLAKDVDLGDNGSIKAGGVTINNGGINAGGKKITNVAPGTNGTDAVNVNQLKGAVTNLDNKINRNNKDLRAGIAGANAAAGLPQVYIPGKSMVSASAGTFKGQNAVAVGYSRASDNGKLILKLQGNANTRGDMGGSVGVGYQW